MTAPKVKCRFCGAELTETFADLGVTPLSNTYLEPGQLDQMEPFYPLRAYVCSRCFLVQLQEFRTPKQIFADYPYFSSYSDSWLQHARNYTDDMIERFGFDHSSNVIEIASNDGYLLQYFKEKGIPVISLTGFSGGRSSEIADVNLHAMADNYGVIEDVHQSILHLLAQFIRQNHMDEEVIKKRKF